MKSQVSYIQGLYAALFQDLRDYYPTDFRHEWDRDESRLLTLSRNHGPKIFTIFLPDLAKDLDLSLSNGFFSCTPSPVTGKDSKRTSPKLFRGLWRRIFEDNGNLSLDVDEVDVKFLRQLLLVAKKLKVDCDEHKTFKSVEEFFIIESETRSPTLNWALDDFCPDSANHLHLVDDYWSSRGRIGSLFDNIDLDDTKTSDSLPGLIQTCQQVADFVFAEIGAFDPLDWHAKHGPGAVSDQKSNESKYSFRNWPDKLNSIFPLDVFAYANVGNWGDEVANGDVDSRFSNHEPPSKLLAVPKTQKGPRLIASEPTAHQWAQQIVNDFLRRRCDETVLRDTIRFNDQTANQQAALRASLTTTHWTIDLSSASDRMSLWCVERIARRNRSLLRALHACRTRWLINKIDKKSSQYIYLAKLAPQGSAFTFPMQSIIYAIVCTAAELYARGGTIRQKDIRSAARTVQVFGDDLVVPKGSGEYVLELLEYLGFKVNHKKTHRSGNFRESCGVDAFRGVDVSPAYITRIPDKARPESIISGVAVHNNFAMKKLWHSAEYIKSTLLLEVPKLKLPEVPMDSVHLGWYSVFPNNKSLKTRVSKDTHLKETRIHRLFAKSKRSPQPGNWSLLQYFTEEPSPDEFWTAGFDSRPKLYLQLGWVPTERLTEVRSSTTIM